MTYQQQALQSVTDTFGGAATMDQILGGVAFVVLIVTFLTYSIWHHFSHNKRSPFDSLH